MKKTPIRKAAEDWLSTFNCIPGRLIEKLAAHDEAVLRYDSDDFRLVASPAVQCLECDAFYEGDRTLSELAELERRGKGVACTSCGSNPGSAWAMGWPRHAFPCAWGTLFAPELDCDQAWLGKHRAEVAKLGIFVFESEDLGYLLGIDGAGYDFYDAHWIPLYELRGLQWHTVSRG